MAEEKDNAEEKDEGQPKRNTALLRLPFGLCKRYGIKIEDDKFAEMIVMAIRRGTPLTEEDYDKYFKYFPMDPDVLY